MGITGHLLLLLLRKTRRVGTGPPARKARPGRHSLLPSLDSAERIACAVTAGSARGQFVSQTYECRQDAPLPRCPGGWDQRGCVFSSLSVSCGSSKENWKWEETGPRLRRLHALHRHKREPRARWGGAGPGLQWWLLLPRLSVTPPSIRMFLHRVSSERRLCARHREPGLRRRTEPAGSPAPWKGILGQLSTSLRGSLLCSERRSPPETDLRPPHRSSRLRHSTSSPALWSADGFLL